MKNDDIDTDDELGFEPAVSVTGAEKDSDSAPKRTTRRSRRGLRRKLGSGIVLLGALCAMGGGYAAFATSSGAEDADTATTADIAAGREIYQNSCITCHGANLEGVKGQGPSLIGVGSAAAYFQVITGRMPVAAQGAYVARKTPKFTEKETEHLAAYVQSVGGGPEIPSGHLRGSNDQIANGGALYRLNCASCHGTTGKGAPLSGGKQAPSLNEATDKELYTAMLSGPENMPVFSDNTITPEEKRSIIAYVQMLKATKDPGGNGIDRIGPVSEAIVIWVAGIGAIMIAILWIGARSR